jgi:Family of unknown function (DUF6492)
MSPAREDPEYDIVVCIGPKDLEVAKMCLSTIQKHVQHYGTIYTITKDPFEYPNTTNILESAFPVTIQDVNRIIQVPSRAGWYYQQLLKMYVPDVISELMEDYVVIDSDTLFLRSISFVMRDENETRRMSYNATMGENHQPYFEWMRRLHPTFEKRIPHSGVCHHMVFTKSILSELKQRVERFQFEAYSLSRPFWFYFLEKVDPSQRSLSGASEYEMYFNYMLQYHPLYTAVRSIPFSSIKDLNELQTTRTEWYVNYHWWNRTDQDEFKHQNEEEVRHVTEETSLLSSEYPVNGFEENEIITGERLQELCDLTIITEPVQEFHTSLNPSVRRFFIDRSVSKEDVFKAINESVRSIFVYTHLLDEFIEKVWPHIDHPVIVMTHNSDGEISEKYLSFINNPKLIHLFSQNALISHDKVTAIPIGLANSMWAHGDTRTMSMLTKKARDLVRVPKIGLNFRTGTYPLHRACVMRDLHMTPTYNCEILNTNLATPDCYRMLQRFRFIACPRGNGSDTHRLWETLYLGCVPLVDDIENTRLFSGLPMIRVSDWKHTSIPNLEESIRQMEPIIWDQLRLSYWKKQLETKLPVLHGSFVLSYLGKLPNYLLECVRQIRIWNPSTPIYIAHHTNPYNEDIISKIIKEYPNIIVVAIEALRPTIFHQTFNERFTNLTMNGFWKYTTERFFIVEEVMRQYHLADVFHLEVDNLIYFEYTHFLPMFQKVSQRTKILSPSDSQTRFIAGVCYIPRVESLSILNFYFSEKSNNQAEMQVMMNFSKEYPDLLGTLPVIMPSYPEKLQLQESDRDRYWNGLETFHSLFDAAAMGQYLGGICPSNNPTNKDTRFFINPDAAYRWDAPGITIDWKRDDKDRRYPIVRYNENEWSVNNLHVHSKNLSPFLSS